MHSLAGTLTPSGHTLHVRVYYEDTDFSGVVYHANYLKFFERGRSDWLRLLGVGHTGLATGTHAGAQGQALAFAVRHMDIDFLRPARIDDVVRIETSLKDISGARVVLSQFAFRDSELLASATVTVAMISPQGRPKRIPAAIAAVLSAAAQQIPGT